MAVHISLRLAWHNDGWNGHICQDPKSNTYCIGQHSFPGDLIRSKRDLSIETDAKIKGKPCSKIDYIPPCALSCNAFGKEKMLAFVEPPEWFRDGSKGVNLEIPPSTVCTWSYEGMYSDDVIRDSSESQTYNYDKRKENALNYFKQLIPEKSLIIYYANYSNPISDDENRKYVIVGISRLKKIGKLHYYENVSDKIKEKYGGGYIWQMPITSNYPDEGFHIPYEKYIDNQEILEKITFIPENPRHFKYATRPLSSDDLLSVVEKLLEIVKHLIEIKDNSENWEIRKNWLLELLSELWLQRGAYPGLNNVLSILDFQDAIEYYKEEAQKSRDKEAFTQIKKFLHEEKSELDQLIISKDKSVNIKRTWKLLDSDVQKFMIDILPRLDLAKKQMESIISTDRANNMVFSNLTEIIENPYIISEQYIGDDQDDIITFNKIDHGMIPSPKLGIDNLSSKNSAERFRALCVEKLNQETTHSFVDSNTILNRVNNKLSYLPEWKKHEFTDKYFEVDEEILEKSIVIRNLNSDKYLYLKSVYEDELKIQSVIEELAQRPDIEFKTPTTEKHFYSFLKDSKSKLITKAPDEYENIIINQAKVCSQIFNKSVSIISGSAGTGKTTIINALIKAIERSEGIGSSFKLLAPTGKAADRIKAKSLKDASTIHSFLAQLNWLNDNFTLKRIGGKTDDSVYTVIIDESSMVNIELMSTLFRAIDWNCVKRLIFVGDPNQLPPIGRGKAFYEIIKWLKDFYPDSVGVLTENVRHLENRINDFGNGILDIANIYIREFHEESKISKIEIEDILKRIQEGGQIDKDLEIIYWKDEDQLDQVLSEIIINDLEQETGLNSKSEDITYFKLWSASCKEGYNWLPSHIQILSPYRGDDNGTEYLNHFFQKLFNNYNINRGSLDGVAIADKVIQFRNRPKSNPLTAYSFIDKKTHKFEVYNGEIGFVNVHPFDKKNYFNRYFKSYRIKKFQVTFDRKENYKVNYGYYENDYGKTFFNDPVEENLELGYAISVHKAQGSEFDHVYLILPKRKSSFLSMELLYTAITRAQYKLTILAQDDVSTFHQLTRVEHSSLNRINSSIFFFEPLPEDLLNLSQWYEEGKIISTLTEYFVRSKSEMNIANILLLKNIPFYYEKPLFAKDGTMYLPDFTLSWQGNTYYWEHVGRLDKPNYKSHWETKEAWYEKHFPGQLLTTYESPDQSKDIEKILKDKLNI